MAWTWGKKGGGNGGNDHAWSREQPDSKKRKVDLQVAHVEQPQKPDANDDEWGDDVYTQDQLEELALLDSQVTLQVSVTAVRAEQSDLSFVAPVGVARKSTSSSSSSSALPQSVSSSRSGHDTSASLSSHSSGKLDTSVDLVHTLQARLDEEKRKAQEEKSFCDGQVKSLREKLHRQEEELEKMRAVRDDRYDQLNQSQNEKIRSLQSQLGNLTTQACFKDREYQNLQEKYAALQQKVKRVEQQQQSATGMLDVRLQLSPKPASPRKVSVEPSPPSKQRQQETRDSASSKKTSFPTAQTFRQQTSPTSVALAVKSVSSTSCQTPGVSNGKQPVQRRLHLNTGLSLTVGETTGPQVVRHLLRPTDLEAVSDVKDEKVLWDPGLAGLLQDMSTSLKISGLTYSREKDSNYLIPHKPHKQTHGVRASGTDTRDETVQIVTCHSLQLAIEGITQLLQDSGQHPGKGSADGDVSRISDTSISVSIRADTQTAGGGPATGDASREPVSATRSCHVGSAQTWPGARTCLNASHTTESLPHSGSVLILPLLRDYIEHYVDLIHSSSGRVGGTLGMGGTSPRSLDFSSDFSSDSLSSHLSLLLQEGRVYASNVESCALTALCCLVVLIYLCPAVRHSIIMSTHAGVTPPFSAVKIGSYRSSSSSNLDTGTQQSKKTVSSADADDEGSTDTSEVRVIRTGSNQSGQSVISGSNGLGSGASSSLLHLVLRLAGQDLQDGQSNPQVVILALHILTCLCQRSTEDELPKLEAVITREILAKCFQQTRHMPVLICAVRLLLSLAKSEKLLAKLCTKSDSCPLYLMHRACSLKADTLFQLQREYVICLSSIVSQHRAGLHFLLSNTCPCTDKLVASLILTLYNMFSTYAAAAPSHQRKLLYTLAQGISLVLTLAQGDGLFAQHCGPVHQQYVRLITGLSSIFKADPETWEQYLPVIDELNEFESDSSDTSLEGEEDDRMDQS